MVQDILIAPGSGEPYIEFYATGVPSPITLNVVSGVIPASGTSELSFEGTQGQLFSVSDNLSSGTIFSVSDVTGLPLIEADASGDVKIGEFGRNVGVGSGILPAYQLDVFGTGNFHQGVRFSDGTTQTTGATTVDTYSSGVGAYASGQAIENETLVTYASGLAIENETDLVYVSGAAAYASGNTIVNDGLIAYASGNTANIAFASNAEGDILYHNGTSFIRLAKGTDDYVLKMNGNVPNWESAGGGAGTMTSVKSNGSAVGGSDIVTLDFSSDFGVAEDPDTEINITIGTLNQNTTGSAATLTTARAINGVSFDGSAAITVTAAGSTLSDTVTVAKGGTGATSFADKSVIITQDSGTDTLAAVDMSTNGRLLIAGSSGPAVANLTQGSNMTITNGDGTITLASAGASPPSDNRLKENIEPLNIKDFTEKLMQLQAVEFDWKEAAKEMFDREGRDFGYVAQDVDKIMPELVGEFNGYKNLDYGKIVVLLLEMTKELKQEVEELKQKLEST
jgi:hypothetical protein